LRGPEDPPEPNTVRIVNICEWYLPWASGVQNFDNGDNFKYVQIGDRLCVVRA
jgi:hypothetical protein